MIRLRTTPDWTTIKSLGALSERSPGTISRQILPCPLLHTSGAQRLGGGGRGTPLVVKPLRPTSQFSFSAQSKGMACLICPVPCCNVREGVFLLSRGCVCVCVCLCVCKICLSSFPESKNKGASETKQNKRETEEERSQMTTAELRSEWFSCRGHGT